MNAQQLKNSILQEAIQGRLVPQDPTDEPASALLERIRGEKERLVKEGKLKKKDLAETPIPEDEIPFEIPDSWEWVRMQDVIEFVNGRAYKRDELLDKGKYKVLRVGNFFTNESWYYSNLELPDEKYCYKDDLLYSWSASFGPKIWDGDKTIFHYHIWNVKYNKNILFRDYLFYFFLIDKESIKSATTGSTMVHVSMENMKPRLLPLPPFAEQKRIVAKIEELLPKVEEYGKAQKALDKLNAELPDRLKKSVLQEAIEGRLVPQAPTDEPASTLLERIREEKQELFKNGLLKKKEIDDRVIDESEVPFPLPKGWAWTKIDNVAFVTKLAGFEYSKYIVENLVSKEKGVPLFKGKNVQNGKIIYKFESYIPLDLSNELKRSQIRKKCLLTPYVGTIGNIGIHDKTGIYHLGSNVGKIEFYNGSCINILEEYVKYYLMSSYGYDELTKYKKATAQESISIEAIRDVFLPLPPLAEQKRIVEKIEEVFAEIDKMKK